MASTTLENYICSLSCFVFQHYYNLAKECYRKNIESRAYHWTIDALGNAAIVSAEVKDDNLIIYTLNKAALLEIMTGKGFVLLGYVKDRIYEKFGLKLLIKEFKNQIPEVPGYENCELVNYCTVNFVMNTMSMVSDGVLAINDAFNFDDICSEGLTKDNLEIDNCIGCENIHNDDCHLCKDIV